MLAIAPLLAGLVSAPQMLLHLRADTGIVLDASQRVALWKDLSPRHTDFGTTNFPSPRAVFLTRYHDTAEKRVYKTFDSNEQLRPRVVAKGIGGHPSVVFDGSQVLVDTTSLPLDAGFTLFAVAQDSTGNGHSATLVDKGPGDFNTDLPNGWADSVNGCFNMGLAWVRNFAHTNFETKKPTLYQSSWDGKSAALRANGMLLATGTGSNPSSRNKSTWIGGVINPHGDLQNFTAGRIAEIRIYVGSMSDSVRKSIEDSLISRYGLTRPPPAGESMLLHLRADTGIVFDNHGRVATWKDLSGRHTDFVTTSFGKPKAVFLTRYHDTVGKRIYKTYDADSLIRPRFIQNGIGGRPSIAFDGQQALVDTTSLPLDSGFTLFAVAQDSTGNGYTAILLDKGPGDFNTDLPNGWDDSINGCFNMGLAWVRNFAQSNFQTSNPTLYQSAWNGQSGTLWANGQFLTSGTGTNPVRRNKSTWIGGVANPYNELQNFITGRISEIRIYRGTLNEDRRKSIEDSLLSRYGLDITPPPPPPLPPLVIGRLLTHLRADTGLVLDATGRVSTWTDLSPRRSNFITPPLTKPELLFLTHYVDTVEKRRSATLDNAAMLRPIPERECSLGKSACVRFDGANSLVDTTWLPLDSGFTMFIVAQDSSGPGAFTSLVDKGPGDMNTNIWTGIDGNFQVGCGWVKNVAKSNLETPKPTLYESSWDSGRGMIWANGQLQGTGIWAGNATRNKHTWLGSVYNQYSVLMGFLTGRIYEVRIYSGSLSKDRRIAIEDSLMARYGLNEPVRPVDSGRLIMHLRADTGLVLDSRGRISTWKDLSPRHTDFVTTNFGKPRAVFLTRYHDTAEKRIYKTYDADSLLRPRIIQDGIGGRPSIAFDGQQALVDTTSLPLDSGFTFFAVAQDSTGNGYTAILMDKGPGDFNTDLPNGWDDSINGCFNMGVAWVRNFAQSNFQTSSPALYQSAWNGQTGTLWVNGQFLASGTGANPWSRNKSTWIGGVENAHDMLQNFLTGRISEMRVYAGTLPTERRKSIEDSLMTRYALKSAGDPGETEVTDQPSRGTRLFRNGSRYQISTTEFEHASLVTPNGKILFNQSIVGGTAMLPEFRGTAILRLIGSRGKELKRILASQP